MEEASSSSPDRGRGWYYSQAFGSASFAQHSRGADHPRSERASGGATSFPLAEHGILCSHTCCCCLQLCMCVRLLQKALLWVVKRVQKGGALLESQDMDGGVGSRTSSVWRRLQFPPKSALAGRELKSIKSAFTKERSTAPLCQDSGAASRLDSVLRAIFMFQLKKRRRSWEIGAVA
jgi:hypothetical protein